MRQYFSQALIAVLFVCAFNGAALADADKRKSILAGSELDYPPYALVTEDGEADGFSVDLIKAVVEELGIDITFHVAPWNEVKTHLERGEIDLLPHVYYSKERDKLFDFSVTHTSADAAIFARKGERQNLTANDLRQETVIAMQSDWTHEYLVTNGLIDKVVLVDTVPDALRLLSSGEHDVAFLPHLVGHLLIRDLGLTNIEIVGDLVPVGRGFAFAVYEGDFELLQRLNEGLAIIKASGRYDKIYEKWFGLVDPKGVSRSTVIRYAVWTGAGVVILTVMIFIWIIVLRRTVAQQTAELRLAHDNLELRVTERTGELRKSEESLSNAQRISHMGSWTWDIANGTIVSSDETIRLFNFEDQKSQPTFDQFIERIHPDDRAHVEAAINGALEGDPYHLECRLNLPNGDTRYIDSQGEVIFDDTGSADQMHGSAMDITERKLEANERKKVEGELKRLFDLSPDFIGSGNLEGYFTKVNPSFGQKLGYEEQEFCKKPFLEYVHDDDVEKTTKALVEASKGTGDEVFSVTNRYKCKDGSYIWIEWQVLAIAEENLFYAFGRDITDRMQAKEAIRQSEEKYRAIFSESVAAIYVFDNKKNFIDSNQAGLDLLGYSREELLGMSIPDVDADPVVVQPVHEELLSGDRLINFEHRLVRIDGRIITVLNNSKPLTDSNGDVIGMESTLIDITERKALEEQLRQSQKMEVVGHLAGGVSHDFNNLLSVMIGNADLLKRKFKGDEKAGRYIDAILRAGDRGASLTGRLLAFSRKQTLSPKPTMIIGLISGLEDMLHRTLRETIELRIHLESTTCEALIDPHQFENALINLSINARDAMPDGGVLTIEIANATLDDTYAAQHEGVTPGDYVEVAVSDTGTGMPPDVLDKVFEPFFTTKEVGKGSGLGLSMVYGFVKQSSGHITIDSEVGHGTTVRLYLPRSGGAATEEETKDETTEFVLGSERILVVEDDEDVRDISTSILRDQGYEVVEARDGGEAIKLLKGGQPFDLIFTDVVLPGGMNGVEIMEEAKRIQPNIKVLFTSGYSENVVDHNGKLDPGVTMISKPFHRAELLKKVRVMFDSEGD